jgi:hypothetical protein
MKTIVPNTVLPKGARLIKPFEKKIGGWVEMEFDAEVERLGLTWYRVKGGMGERKNGDREDWIADIPSCCISIHDYQWREPRWGSFGYESFDKAIAGRTKEALSIAKHTVIALELKLADVIKTVELITKACEKI